MIEYLYNIYNEVATVEEHTNGTATATLENGKTKTFPTYEKAVNVLYKMGFRF